MHADQEHRKNHRQRPRWTKAEWIIFAILLSITFTILLQSKFLWSAQQLAKNDIEKEDWALAYNTAKVQYDNLPEAELKRIADGRIIQLKRNGQLEAEIQKRAAEYRSGMQDAGGVTYPTHVDSYLYLRYAQDIVQHGTYGVRGLKGAEIFTYDPLRNAPSANLVAHNPLPYFFALGYQGIRFIAPHTSFLGLITWYPVILGVLLISLFYLLLRCIAGVRAAQLSALFLAIHPQLFAAFQWGYTDTNAFNITCGAGLLMLAYTMLTAQKWTWRISAGVAAVVVYLLFNRVWSGATVFGILAIGVLGIGIAMWLWQHPTLRKHRMILLLLVVIISMGSGFWVYGNPLKDRIVHYLTGQSAGSLPNPFPYVGEFKTLRAADLISQVGGSFFPLTMIIVALGGIGLVILIQWAWKKPERRIGAMVLLAWFLALAYPATRVRFLQFSILPIAALVGIGSAGTIAQCAAWIKPISRVSALVPMVVAAMLLIAILPSTVVAIYNANPVMNDAIANVSLAIKQDSPPDAIIATWWNDGYLYQYFAERGTYFDGASFDSEKSYWMSRYFMETDRQVSRNILRAQSCEFNALTSLIRTFPNNTMAEVNSILQMNRTRTEQTLRTRLGNKAFEPIDSDRVGQGMRLVSELYCDHPRQTYLVVSEEFLNLVWAFDWYGKVDFEHPNASISGRSELNAVAFGCNTFGKKIVCEQGISADFEIGKAKDALGRTIPFFFNDGTHLYRPQEDVPPNKPVLILFVEGDRLRGALINSDILNSMFVKLFFFDGAGMPEYEKIAEASGRYQPRVVAYRVNFTAEI